MLTTGPGLRIDVSFWQKTLLFLGPQSENRRTPTVDFPKQTHVHKQEDEPQPPYFTHPTRSPRQLTPSPRRLRPYFHPPPTAFRSPATPAGHPLPPRAQGRPSRHLLPYSALFPFPIPKPALAYWAWPVYPSVIFIVFIIK